jgi:hypothetical protein
MAVRRAAASIALALTVLATVGPHAGHARDRRAQKCGASTLVRRDEPLRAASKHGEVWALPFGTVPPTVGQDLKIVWRVTGRGPLLVTFRNPSGHKHSLTFGPELHSASSFQRPGREWGTGFTFDATGCWTIQVKRSGTSATVGVRVT